jgi:hypothetical protein
VITALKDELEDQFTKVCRNIFFIRIRISNFLTIEGIRRTNEK